MDMEIHLTAEVSEVHLRTEDTEPIHLLPSSIPSIKEILMIAYPVGSLWATDDADADPAEDMGFGVWQKVSPGAVTWEMLGDQTWNIQGTVFGYYIWRRIEQRGKTHGNYNKQTWTEYAISG